MDYSLVPYRGPTEAELLLNQFKTRFREQPITPAVARMISSRAWKLSRRVVDGDNRRGEFETQFILAAIGAADRWDPARGSYLCWVRGALDFCERKLRGTLKRESERLSRTVFIDSFAVDASSAVVDLMPVDGVWRMVNRIDLAACREWLQGLERDLLDLFVQGLSRNAIRRWLRLPRTSFYGTVWPTFIRNVQEFYHD